MHRTKVLYIVSAGLTATASMAQDKDKARGAEPQDTMALAQQIRADYPARALRNGEQGTVTMQIGVDETGRVNSCTVTQTSGSSNLDQGACESFRQHAKFKPARDATGRAIESTLTQSVRYILPGSAPKHNPNAIAVQESVWRERVFDSEYTQALEATDRGAAMFFLTLDIFGKPTGCAIMYPSSDPDVDKEGCDRLIKHAEFLPPELPNGKPYAGIVPVIWPSADKIPGVRIE